jgi:hypothetical protein
MMQPAVNFIHYLSVASSSVERAAGLNIAECIGSKVFMLR